jgi:hypothetical protein
VATEQGRGTIACRLIPFCDAPILPTRHRWPARPGRSSFSFCV